VVGAFLPRQPHRHRIDFLGAGLAAAFSTALPLVTGWSGKQPAWSSPRIIGLALAAVATLVLFLRRQKTAAEPVQPLSLFRVPELRWGFAIQGLMGAAMAGWGEVVRRADGHGVPARGGADGGVRGSRRR
jgi:hypothetical protein